MGTPDILAPAVREPLDGLQGVAALLRGTMEAYLSSLEAACLAAYGEDACAVHLAHCVAEVRASLHGLIRLDERGDVWGVVGDLEEELVQLGAEDEQRALLLAEAAA